MKISLVFPRLKYKTGDPPRGMAIIASQLRKEGNSIDFIDSTFHPTLEYIYNRINSFDSEVVAIYVDSLVVEDVKKIAKFAKNKGKMIILGGPQATIKPESLTDLADYIIKGEAELVFQEILDGKHKEKIVQGIKPDLEKLPIPAYDLLEMENYINHWHLFDSINTNFRGTNMFSSRGCPFRCTFCQPVLDQIFGKGVRTRSVNNVIEEIKYLINNFGINAIWFNDDTFTVRKQWIKDFCKRLEEENLNIVWGINSRIDTTDEEQMQIMYNAGLRIMHIGVETGSQRVADEIYNKGIDLSKVPKLITTAKKIGIDCLCYFMLGAPGETREEIEETIRFARSLDATEITATIATPLPGTYMYKNVKDKYDINEEYDYYKNTVFKNPTVPFNQIKYLQKKLLFQFYTHPKRWSYIAKHISSPNGIKKMVSKIKRYI